MLLAVCSLTVCARTNRDEPQQVDIGNRRLYIHCSGRPEAPTVILEAGSGETSESWGRVQPQVAEFARVCSYDRAGLGKSLAVGHEESIAENVADLHSLLERAGVAPPYVLVAHSSGGLRAREFQRRFQKEVAGMVLLDSSHEEQGWRFNNAIPGSVRGIPEDPEGLAKMGMLPRHQRLQWHVDIPLIVIEHGKPMQLPPAVQSQSEVAERAMRALQQDLASRSSRGELRKAEQSGHDIPNEQPEAVVRAVHDVLDRAGFLRTGK